MPSSQPQQQTSPQKHDLDPFDELLGLEDTYYDEGYQVGQQDGRKAGLIEGRAFGMEKAFEKFSAMGRMHGRAVVWAGRLPDAKSMRHPLTDQEQLSDFLPNVKGAKESSNGNAVETRLKDLTNGPRLAKHVRTLWALTEPESLAVANEEEGVSDFDDRYKRAVAKTRIIGRIVDEEVTNGGPASGNVEDLEPGVPQVRASGGEVGIEDVDILKVRH